MEFTTSVVATLLPKLGQLLHSEYKLHKSVRGDIEFLIKELETIQAALRSVNEVPAEQVADLDKIWAREARELAYDMEDVVDTFLVCIEGPDKPSKTRLKRLVRTMKNVVTGKRHQIGEEIKDIKKRIVELAVRHDRYKDHIINPLPTKLDPRVAFLYAKETDLVGINEAREELVLKLQEQKIVSIVGFGGLGKTTLAKAVHDKIKSQFDCTAFVTVSQNPDMKKFIKDMLRDLDESVYDDVKNISLDEKQLIDIARKFLHDKRYLIIIDDIWDTSYWDLVIRHALPDNNTGCRIIVTTRNVKVASHIGIVYKMKALSAENSRALFYRRIFGTEDQEKCFSEELAEVSDRILKKCAGVPLAIITIASLLAGKGRNKTTWDEVCNSIGNGMGDNFDVDNMRKILLYSYYDLPPHLRTCLLYLSIFPEDLTIEKYRLIFLWIAEGFVQHGKQRNKSLLELGESYFNDLINRSMIQPIYTHKYSIEIMECRVHDMVLDLIRSISSEENFVTISNSVDMAPASRKVRRLSLQNSKTDHAMTKATPNMLTVRSLVAFPSALDQIPTLDRFKVLRVLDLEDCDLSRGYSLKYLGSLFHLRHLNLNKTGIRELPEAIANLKFLEVLYLLNNEIDELPKCVAQLTHLLCLMVDEDTRISCGIGSLTSLEILSPLHIDEDSADTIHCLGLLTELRALNIFLETDKHNDKLVESLCKLKKIQYISFESNDNYFNMSELDAWVLPELRGWNVEGGSDCWFSKLPRWMKKPMQFQDLSLLHINIKVLHKEDLEILGKLPALCHLRLEVDHLALQLVETRFVIGAGGFPCLVKCELKGLLWPMMFHQGAMPRLRSLKFSFHMQKAREIIISDGGLDCGLENLSSLEKASITIKMGLVGDSKEGVQEADSEEEGQEAEAALRHAAEIHPNRPLIKIYLEEVNGRRKLTYYGRDD